jgi:Ca2+-binding EF-hand superfamily protein
LIFLKFPELKNCFDCFDSDKSGSISVNELEKLFSKLGMAIKEKEIQNLMNLMDSVSYI